MSKAGRDTTSGTDRARDPAEPDKALEDKALEDKALEAAKTYWALDAAERRWEMRLNRVHDVLSTIVSWFVTVVLAFLLIGGSLFTALMLPKNDGFIEPGVAIIIGALIIGGAILYRRT